MCGLSWLARRWLGCLPLCRWGLTFGCWLGFCGSSLPFSAGLLALSCWFRLVLVVIVFDDILHNQRNSAVGRIQWVGRDAEFLVRIPADLRDLISTQTVFLHDAT